MFSRQIWFLKRMTRRLWFTASLHCLFGVATALGAIWLATGWPRFMPTCFPIPAERHC